MQSDVAGGILRSSMPSYGDCLYVLGHFMSSRGSSVMVLDAHSSCENTSRGVLQSLRAAASVEAYEGREA